MLPYIPPARHFEAGAFCVAALWIGVHTLPISLPAACVAFLFSMLNLLVYVTILRSRSWEIIYLPHESSLPTNNTVCEITFDDLLHEYTRTRP
jgi:hypothetical protein